MRTQFIRQSWQDRHRASSSSFRMDEVYLRWIAIQQQILDTDVHEFIHARPGQKQRLDHQSIFALAAVGDLNQTFDLAVFQPGDGAGSHAWRLERQPATDSFHDVFGLIIAEMVLTPEVDGLLHDVVERLRPRFLTTPFIRSHTFQSSHTALAGVE